MVKQTAIQTIFVPCFLVLVLNRYHTFSTYAKFSEKLAFHTPDTGSIGAYQEVRYLSFSEHFAHVLHR